MRERRLVFGEVAELYDQHRPAYPDVLIDDLIAMANLDRDHAVLEVGAGTGKATVMFAARGIPVVGVEPSAEMAAIARRNCGGYPDVELEQSDFEQWDSGGRQFPLLFSAQAWHWVDTSARYAKACQVIAPRGLFAAFWNRAAWGRAELREPLLREYERIVPDLSADGPMHPANLNPDTDEDWEYEIAAVDGLCEPELRHYEWEQHYSPGDYVGLLTTLSEIRLLDAARRAHLLDAVAAVIAAHGGRLSLPMRTRLSLARRG